MYNNNCFESITPESAGIASKDIAAFLSALQENKINIQGYMLLRYNKLLSSGIAFPYRFTDKRHVYSISKCFTSTAIGMAVDEGLLSPEDTVLSFFPEWAPKNPSQNLKDMRIRHLLCMGSGHAKDTIEPMLSSHDNWVKTFLSLTVEHTPGTFFVYNSGASYMLSAILQKVTGQNLSEFLTPRLFEPLNITGIVWDKSPQDICIGGWGLHISMDDMAKLGLLYLNKGIWQGRRLLSENWISTATSAVVSNADNKDTEDADWRHGYGYHFWRCRHNCYRGDGAYGQYIIVSPDKDMVAVIISETNRMQKVLDLFWEKLYCKISDTALEPNSLDDTLLKLKADSMVCNKIEQSPIIQHPYHQSFSAEENPFNITKLTLNVKSRSCFITIQSTDKRIFEIGCEKSKWTYLNEKSFPISPVSGVFDIYKNSDATIAAAYYWKSISLLIIKMQFVDSPHAVTFKLNLASDKNTVSVQKSTDPDSAKRTWQLNIV